MTDIGRLIQRLEEALELQRTARGEIGFNPDVEYCFECDDITVDELGPQKCLDHHTVMSDGYEHGGIQAALTALRYLHTEGERS